LKIKKSIPKLLEKLHIAFWRSRNVKFPSTVCLKDILNFLEGVGIGNDSTMLVHSSWNALNSGNFCIADLIQALIDAVGTKGTLLMPAFPHRSFQVNNSIFDINKTPSAGGLVSEAFRRFPGVDRSINLNHSVCAIGPMAKFLTKDHHLSQTPWDEMSPYYRLKEVEDAWIIGLGVGHHLKVATSLHCVESILQKEILFYKRLFENTIEYKYIDSNDREGNHIYKSRAGFFFPPKVSKFFTSSELIETVIKGLELYAIRADLLINKSLDLGRKGKTMYVWPIPWKWYFK
jgi:aminoglycoside 3-N-acetyltransferase